MLPRIRSSRQGEQGILRQPERRQSPLMLRPGNSRGMTLCKGTAKTINHSREELERLVNSPGSRLVRRALWQEGTAVRARVPLETTPRQPRPPAFLPCFGSISLARTRGHPRISSCLRRRPEVRCGQHRLPCRLDRASELQVSVTEIGLRYRL